MEMSHFKPDHVAQQSRRHKLRFQQSSTQPHPFEDISSNLDHVQFQPGLDTQVYNSSSISSQMLNFSNPNGSKNAVSHLNSSSFNADTTSGGNVEKSGVWRSVGSNQSCSQMINFGSGLAASRRSDAAMVDLQGSADDLAKFMNNRSQEMNPDSPQLNYQNSYRDHIVTTAFIGQQAGNYLRGNVPNSNWSSQYGNELALLPTYREDSNVLNQNNAASWISRVVEEGNQWNSELGFLPNKTECGLRTAGNESSPQGLNLSLCSNPSSTLHGSRFGDRSIPEALSSRAFETTEESKPPRPSKPVSRSSGGSLQDVVVGTSNNCNRQMGPLGPFTGYATILKSSRFLRPAQQLLDEFCGIVGSKLIKVSDSWEKNAGEACALADAVVKFADTEVQSKSSTSDVPLPTSQRSDNQLGKLVGAAESSSCDSHSPENQHRKAKLLYMQEEVSRRCKQYHQQMQMVVASFESVAGLTGATPYISLALRTVSKHFRHLKNGISEQLRNIRTTLGEDLSSQTAGMCNGKTHGSGSRMKTVDHKFSDSGLHAPQQHIWRPQRGLPERAVSVLRAWLFEHFLHPYPTDTDKHMLATQTGLTRNQVSNWFINARVRLWKPMVEEIHMLETNGVTERDVNLVKEGKNSSTIQGTSKLNSDNSSNEFGTSDRTIKQFECSTIAPRLDTEQYKRSRVEAPITPIMDGGMMDFVPYYRSGLEMAGHGSVSLTLGLRQSADHRHVVEGARYHHEQLQQEDHIRRHFGSHIHEFVG